MSRNAAAIVLVLAMAAAGCDTPPLRVSRAGDFLVLDVQTLGEYQTSVARIRVSQGRRVVWEVASRDRPPQLHTVLLRMGANQAVPLECGGGPPRPCDRPWPNDEFRIVVPEDGTPFRLERGEEYTVEVWGSDSRWSRAAATFTP